MSTIFKNMLADKALSMTSLLLLAFAMLSAPFLILQSTRALAGGATLPCTEGNHNGCTELSAMPPEDMQAVPPNLVLMLDDSGSMAWDYMPDWGYLANTSVYGTRNSGINYVYYDPTITYTPPPKADATTATWQADSTWYPNSPSMIAAYTDGFNPASSTNIVGGSGYVGGGNGHTFNYTDNLATTLTNTVTTPPTDPVYKGLAVWGGGTPYIPGGPGKPASCNANYYFDPANPNQCIRDPIAATHSWTCNSGDGAAYNSGGTWMCHHKVWKEGVQVDEPYLATDAGWVCTIGTLKPDHLCYFDPIAPNPAQPPTDPIDATPDYMWICKNGGSITGSPPGPPNPAPECWTAGTPGGTTNTPINVRAFTYVVGSALAANRHYVIPNKRYNNQDPPTGGWCSVIKDATQKKNCTDGDSTAGTGAPVGVAAEQNVANWFSYYRTRMLMAKTSLMTAFSGVDPKYRFGFASINGNGTANIPAGSSTTSYAYAFDDSTADGLGGNASNKLAVVQPFGDGSAGTQKALFWTWLASVEGAKGTPLRKALNAVGQYYSTANPWKTMPGDPGWTTGSTAKFTCRAAYTILTTDGFWNGDTPANPSSVAGAASVDGPVQIVPTGAITQYKAVAPFSGGGISGDVSLADVATYYWERDLSDDLNNEVAAGKKDPATWQHMTTFTVGLGFPPAGITPAGTTVPQIFSWATGGAAITGFSWPTPASDSLYNIADLAHAAVNGRGDFFNVKNTSELADAFSKALADIAARNVAPRLGAVNASVLSLGAAAFKSGYQTSDWTGQFQSVLLNTKGLATTVLWKADELLDASYHSPTTYANRTVYTGAYTAAGYNAFKFNATNSASFDSTELDGLQTPALAGGNDTLTNRIKYLLGDNSYEVSTGAGYRARSSILGAVVHSDPVYVAGAIGNYRNSWPTFGTIAPPEARTGAQKYDAFVNDVADRTPMVYVGANDGMLHAFRAPVPECTGTIDSSTGDCSAYSFDTGAEEGTEAWGFIPRAVYANLGNLTNNTGFQYRPTVDATSVTRDVFFSQGSSGVKDTWHTILTSGVGIGGRGVFTLDITDPESFSTSSVLWEFDADMAVSGTCVSNIGSCKGTDLGFTVSQPNVGRLANGQWVVLVPNGYFPDCGTPDPPTKDLATCQAIAAQVPRDADGNPYSALFVFDAQTGAMIAELKTPTDLGVTSFGLAKAVLGDYNSDQVDDVAFAGDVQGNLWRFDLSSTSPSAWSVSLVYKGVFDGGHQGVQPITTMPRLFPDPGTNRFLVLFGTGKYLGVGDNSNSVMQAVYAVRDTAGKTWDRDDLTQQYLHETVLASGPNTGSTLRCVSGKATDSCSSSATPVNSLPGSGGGWFINLYTTNAAGDHNDSGERVVVNPGAIFASNTVVFESMITGATGDNACAPSLQGAILALNATTGGPSGMSTLGGWPTAGARINDARTSGSLPVISSLGGANGYIPTASLAPSSSTPIAIDVPIWRRRSWRVLMHDQ